VVVVVDEEVVEIDVDVVVIVEKFIVDVDREVVVDEVLAIDDVVFVVPAVVKVEVEVVAEVEETVVDVTELVVLVNVNVVEFVVKVIVDVVVVVNEEVFEVDGVLGFNFVVKFNVYKISVDFGSHFSITLISHLILELHKFFTSSGNITLIGLSYMQTNSKFFNPENNVLSSVRILLDSNHNSRKFIR
jgi:hypothetical protein